MSQTAVVHSMLLTLLSAALLMGQTPAPSTASAQADKVIEGFRQITKELNESVKSFYTHLDQEIARHDRGYRLQNRQQVQSADADLIGGPPDITWAAIRKFTSFRMLAVRQDATAPEPAAAADLEHIQQLIIEARKRVDASTATLRRLLVVSVVDFDPREDAAVKASHDQLLKARVGAEEAAKRALLTLPIDLQNVDIQDVRQQDAAAPEDIAEKAWDLLGRTLPAQSSPLQNQPVQKQPVSTARQQPAPAVPIRFERRKRVTLINEFSYRMAMTDSGIEDSHGRRIFYQEEWVQRGQSVIRFRWRVAVETATGEHILLKRYPPRELQGTLDNLYGHRDRDYVWYLEPPDDATEPTRHEIESALAEVARSREAVHAAAQDFKTGVRDAMAKQDIDSGLPEGMRERLFAIRAHLARVPAVLEAESAVRRAISQAETSVRNLEPLAAWANRISGADWAQLLDRSDWEIDSTRNAETEALRTLPPDSALTEDQFPALDRNSIIRIRNPHSKNPGDKTVRCLQEVWRMETGPIGTREVKRIVSLILVDPRTGNQTRVGGATKIYKASPEDILEEIFDEYAADEVSLGPVT
jgi:hypothetical protein